MESTSRILTALSVAAAITGISWYAIAASWTGSLPPTNGVKGWEVWDGTRKTGRMGGKASYDAFNGAVDAMKTKGIRYFAEQMYKRIGTKKHLTVAVFQLRSVATARALYLKKKHAYQKADFLSNYRTIKDRALVGTIKSFTFACCQRGKYLCEVKMSGASGAGDRAAAKSFITYVSKRLGPEKPKT